MGRDRKLFKIGEHLPGRLPDDALACSHCWVVKRTIRFAGRPMGGRMGPLYSSCDSCRKKLREQGRRRARRQGVAPTPVGGHGCRFVHPGEKPQESRSDMSQKNPRQVTLAWFPAWVPEGATATAYAHAWKVTDKKGRQRVVGW